MSNFKLNFIAKSILSLMVVMPAMTHATVTVYKNHEKRITSQEAQFSQTGISAEKADLIKGYGENIPLTVSLDIIVPSHWDISYNEGAENLLLNWKSTDDGLAWPYVLEDLSKKNNISVHIDWNRKFVDLFAHKVKENSFNELYEMDSNTPNKVEDQIALEKILKEKEEQERNNNLLQKMVEDQKMALSDNARVIEELIADQQKKLKEESQNPSYFDKNTYDSDKELSIKDGNAILFTEIENNENTALLQISEEDFKTEYDSKFVLPLNSSFEFYKDGGWQQTFDFYTPATFIAKRGLTIEQILTEWATAIGWEITYESNVHYTLDFDIKFEGIAREASRSLVALYEDSDRPLDVFFYTQQKLIVVKDLSFKVKK